MLALPAIFVFAAVVVAAANWLALRSWRKSVGQHWTERARRLWPARAGAVWNVVVAGALGSVLFDVLALAAGPAWYFRLTAGIAGGLAGSYFFDREIFPAFTLWEWCRHMLAGWGLQVLLAAVLIAGMLVMPAKLNAMAVGVAAVSLGTLLAIRLKLGVVLLRVLRIVEPADVRLRELVQATAGPLGVPVAGVWILGGPSAQAYALPVTGELWFSRRLLAICSDDEIRAVAAHEIAHLGESRLTVAGRISASLTWWPLVFISVAIERFGFGGFVGLLLLCVGLSSLSRRLSHRMERRADRLAADAQARQGVYAETLEKLYRENQVPAVNPKGQRTHPSLYDRLLAAGKVPDYPRPNPPGRLPWPTKLLMVLIVVALLYPVFRDAVPEREHRDSSEGAGEVEGN